MIGELEVDVGVNLRELFAETAVIRRDRRLALTFAVKVKKAHERLRFTIIQLRLARLLFKVDEIHVISSLLKVPVQARDDRRAVFHRSE
jgi:hypothetical protein